MLRNEFNKRKVKCKLWKLQSFREFEDLNGQGSHEIRAHHEDGDTPKMGLEM